MQRDPRNRASPYARKPFYPKRRAPIACEVCRSRKSKCDGETPCGFCERVGAECNYVALSEALRGESSPGNNQASDADARCDVLEAEVRRLSEAVTTLQRNWDLLQSQSYGQTPASGHDRSEVEVASHHTAESSTNTHDVRSCSIMGNMTTTIDFDITRHLMQLESESQPVTACLLTSTSTSPPKLLDVQLMAVFFERVHRWYPIFDRQSLEASYVLASTRPLVPSSESCMFLMVSALGCLALDLRNGGLASNSAAYASPALQMLHVVLPEASLPAAQCMILCALYHLLYFRPVQACEYLNSASYKLQNLYRQRDLPIVRTELYRRAFYAVYILERQLLVHIDLAGFGISDWQEEIPLPSGTFENDHTDEGELIEFYLAEIAMNKIMERADQNLATNLIHRPAERRQSDSSMNRNVSFFANVVAKEIHFQISEWRKHLPPHVTFPVSGTTCASELSLYLKVQYHAITCGVYWHALYQATVMENRSPDVMSACQECLDSFRAFVDSAVELLTKPVSLPQFSMTLASVFSISLAVILVKDAPIPKDMRLLEDSCTRALGILRRYSVLYPATWRWADELAIKLNPLKELLYSNQ